MVLITLVTGVYKPTYNPIIVTINTKTPRCHQLFKAPLTTSAAAVWGLESRVCVDSWHVCNEPMEQWTNGWKVP